MPLADWMAISVAVLVLLSSTGGSASQVLFQQNGSAIPQFSSQALFYGDANSINYPESTLRYIRVLLDDRTNTLHVVGWYFRELEGTGTKKLLHFVLRPDKKPSMITVSETGEPTPPLHLFLYPRGGIRIIWSVATRSFETALSRTLYEYIWREDETVSFNSLPAFPFGLTTSTILQDASGGLCIVSFETTPIDEANSFFNVRYLSEISTEWIEKRFPATMVSSLFKFAIYDAIISQNGTISVLLHCGDVIGAIWVDYLLFVQFSNESLTILKQDAPTDVLIHNVRMLLFPDNSIALVANMNNLLYGGKFDVAGLSFEPFDLPDSSSYVSEFKCAIDPNNHTVIAFVAHSEKYEEPGILSILQEIGDNEWQRYPIDKLHRVFSIWETREGWMDAWSGREGYSNFALDASAAVPILALASIPSSEELNALEVKQKRVCSLYVAQDASHSLSYEFMPLMKDLDRTSGGTPLKIADWAILFLGCLAIIGVGSILILIRRRSMDMQKSSAKLLEPTDNGK
ncbi:MAG: hypothetical protein ACFFGZ_08585 [Candidatus Thorarchaeota archaeon]